MRPYSHSDNSVLDDVIALIIYQELSHPLGCQVNFDSQQISDLPSVEEQNKYNLIEY